MLRLLVLLLLLANGAYFAWAQGYLQPWGMGPLQQSEPQRMEQQIRPESVRVLPRDEARRIDATAARLPECLQTPLFAEAQAEPLRQVLAGWPNGSWSLENGSEPARWIVYMGKYANAEHVERKKAELRQLGVSFEALANPDLEPGLSLGGSTSQADANQQLARLANRGVRTARVVQERAEVAGVRLTLPAVDEAVRPRLEELRTALAGKPLRPCR
jgi:hypothetical protein